MSLEYTKDVMLALLYASDGETDAAPVRGRTRLQKMLFLLAKEHRIDRAVKEFYKFEPYRFGPFDSRIYDDLEFLENVGLVREELDSPEVSLPEAVESEEAYGDALVQGDIEDSGSQYTEPRYSLTPDGTQFVEEKIWPSLNSQTREAFLQVKRLYNNAPLAALLRHVYANYSEYTEKSELQWLRR